MNILYLFDDSAHIRGKAFLSLKRSNAKKLFIAPLTIREEHRNSIIQNIRNIVPGAEVGVLDFSDDFNERALSEKDTYVKFISDFADSKIFQTQNVKEYFAFPFKKFSIWWLSLIAEKNTSKSDSYHRLVKFLTILNIRERYNCERIWLDISDDAIVTLVKRYFRNSTVRISNLRCYCLKAKDLFLPPLVFTKGLCFLGRLILKAAYIKIIMRSIKGRKDAIKKSEFLFITYFPLFDKEAFENNKFIDKYFESLQIALEENQKRFSWLAFIGDYREYSFKEIINIGKLINNNRCLFFCEEWFSLRDLFTVFFVYIYTAIKYIFGKSRLSHNFRYPGIDIELWPLFRCDWLNSFVGSYLISGLAHYTIFRNISKMLESNSTILYPAEMHSWEKALNAAFRQVEELRTVGVQHSIVPLLLLNYFNNKSDLMAGDNIQKMPRPTYLGCVGKIPLRLFKDMGWPEEEIFLLGPLRFQSLKNNFSRRIKWRDRENILVVALPILSSESLEILQYIYYAFRKHCNYKILIKWHPACPVKNIIGRLGFDLSRTKFHITERSLNEILPSAKVSVVTESTSALEAFIYECPVIIPKLINIVDKSPLTGVTDLGIYVDNPTGLRYTTDSIMESRDNPIISKRYHDFVNEYFEFQDSYENFLTRLKCPK